MSFSISLSFFGLEFFSKCPKKSLLSSRGTLFDLAGGGGHGHFLLDLSIKTCLPFDGWLLLNACALLKACFYFNVSMAGNQQPAIIDVPNFLVQWQVLCDKLQISFVEHQILLFKENLYFSFL